VARPEALAPLVWSYYLSRDVLLLSSAWRMARWRNHIFVPLRVATPASASVFFGHPPPIAVLGLGGLVVV